MDFQNEEKFFEWLNSVLKPEYNFTYTEANRAEWLGGVEKAAMDGNSSFEVGSLYTKSGCSECISFTATNRYYVDDEVISIFEDGELVYGEEDFDDYDYGETSIRF